ncbi:MAG: hypothetical protein ACPGYP_03210 [Solirubrobacterales bacterium]
MTDDLATIDSRFKGPPESGNGGYACGVLGTLIGDCAEVTLRKPPPLDTPMRIDRDGDEWRLLGGDETIASGTAAELQLDVPAPPSLDQAIASEAAFVGFKWHPFSGCFVCGPDREEHDGLRLFTGPVGDRKMVASHWLPDRDVAGDFGAVKGRIVWAALDCPTYFGGRLADYPRVAVLGRLTAKILHPIEVGEPHIVVGWPIDSDERKWHGGSAIYTADGELRAFARGTWVVIPSDTADFAVAS